MRRTSLTRVSSLLSLCAAALACGPAAMGPVASPEARSSSPSDGETLEDIRSPRLGVELAVPRGASLRAELTRTHRDEKGVLESRTYSLVLAWPDGSELTVARSDSEARLAVGVPDSYVKRMKAAFSKLDRDDVAEIAGTKSAALAGVADGKRGHLRIFAMGRSLYTLFMNGPASGVGVAQAERIFASMRLSPGHGLHVAPDGRYAVALPDTAASALVPASEDRVAVETFTVDTSVPDVLMVLTVDLPEEVKKGGEDGMFQHALTRMASKGAQFGRLRAIEVDGIPARDIEWSKQGEDGGMIYFRSRALLVGDTMFMPTATSRDKARLEAADAAIFLDSFRPTR